MNENNLSKSVHIFTEVLKASSDHIPDQCLHTGKGGLDSNLLISLSIYTNFVLPSITFLYFHVEKLSCLPKTTSLPSCGEFCPGNLKIGLLRFTKYCANIGVMIAD